VVSRGRLLAAGACIDTSVVGVALRSSACGLLAPPESARLPRIGYQSPGPREAFAEFNDAFSQGVYVDQTFRCAKPAELPTEKPTGWNLVVNTKTPTALRLTIPGSALPLVTEWIQ